MTCTRTKDDRLYSIGEMKGFNIARHLGIEEPDQEGDETAGESVTGCSSNLSPNLSPDLWAQGKEPEAPGGDKFNPSPEATCHPNPSPLEALQGKGSGYEVTGMTGFQPKTHIEKQVCISTNTANAYSTEFALKPVIPVTRPSIDLIPPPAEQIEKVRQRQAKPKPPAHRAPSTAAEWVEAALAELRLAPHCTHLPEVVAWVNRQPTAPLIAQAQLAGALDRLQRDDRDGEQQGLDLEVAA